MKIEIEIKEDTPQVFPSLFRHDTTGGLFLFVRVDSGYRWIRVDTPDGQYALTGEDRHNPFSSKHLTLLESTLTIKE